MQEDEEYYKEQEDSSAAMFGIGAIETDRNFQIRVFNAENKVIGVFYPILDTLPNAINTYKQVFEKYSREKTITLEAIKKI